MPTVAAFVAIHDPNFTIPDPAFPSKDRHIGFDLPDFAGGRRGILLFRVQAVEDSKFQFLVNKTTALTHTLKKGDGRSFHEIYPGSELTAESNELTFYVEKGRIIFSDVVFFYQVTV